MSCLGGHEYKTAVPISQNGDSQGTRLFLNSLFDSECATDVGVPVLSVDASAPAFTLIPEITFTLSTTNTMGSVAHDAVLSDAVPPGATFVSASDGGVEAGGVVSFNLENLGKGETKSVNYTVSLSAPGSYKNSATLNYKVGITSFSKMSNMTETLYDPNGQGGAGGGGGGSSSGGAGGVGGSGSSTGGSGGSASSSSGGAGGNGVGGNGVGGNGSGGETHGGNGNGGAGNSPGDEGSCGCRVVAPAEPAESLWLATLAAGALLVRRRFIAPSRRRR